MEKNKSDMLFELIRNRRSIRKFLDKDVYNTLVTAYYNHTENRPFLQLGIILAIYKTKCETMNLEGYIETWRQSPILKDIFDGCFDVVVDDFVIDKHTSKGRKLAKNISDFVNEGAFVVNQDEKYYNKELEELYKSRK